jgi:hypothetical protein
MLGIGRVVILCLLLAACAVREGNLKIFDSQRAASASERAAIVADIKGNYFDPYSIRDAQISSAVEGTGLDGSKSPPMICVDDNAKNRMGGYTGKSATVYYFNGAGQITRSVNSRDDMFVDSFCKDSRLQYTPFSEIEQKT